MKLFGSSGIRGRYGSFVTSDLALKLGRAVGSLDYRSVIVARDTRLSGETLCHALRTGLLSSGCEVVDLGVLPTPLLCFATRHFGKDCGVMITASHNPGEYNGFKLCKQDGCAFSPHEGARIEQRILENKLPERPSDDFGSGRANRDVVAAYLQTLHSHFTLEGTAKLLLDAGNGAAFQLSPKLLREFGYEVVEVNCTPDGSFPYRDPEPTAQTLHETAKLVATNQCQLGFCHDGDADRVVVIDDQGRVVDFDKFLVFLAREIVEVTGIRRIVTTVDASMLVERVLTNVEVVRTRVGDVSVAHALREQPSAFGGEPCGAYLFPSHGLWPDGVYAIFKILELLERKGKPLSELLDELPTYCTIREKFLCRRGQKEAAMELIKERLPQARSINTIDGIRADYGSHVVLIRPSGTEDLIRFNLEAHSREVIDQERPHFAQLITEAIGMVSHG